MLLYANSFGYGNAAALAKDLSVVSGFVPVAGPRYGKGAIRLTAATPGTSKAIVITHPEPNGRVLCVFGAWVRCPWPGASAVGPELLIRDHLGLVQCTIYFRPTTTGRYLPLIFFGSPAISLLKAGPECNLDQWSFLEARFICDQFGGGSVVVRINGGEHVEVVNVRTANEQERWKTVEFRANGTTCDFSEAYVLDEQTADGPIYQDFLGPVTCSTLKPNAAKRITINGGLVTSFYYTFLHLWLGQSNTEGRGSGTPPSRSPIPIQIYNPFADALQNLTPGTNSAGHLTTGLTADRWGPETSFAEKLCQLEELTVSTQLNRPGTSPNALLVKAGKDAASLSASLADFTFKPDFSGNLYNGSSPSRPQNTLGMVRRAIQLRFGYGPAGPWPGVETHVYYLQGESDAIGYFSPTEGYLSYQNYYGKLSDFITRIRADIPGRVVFHIARISPKLTPILWPFADTIRQQQLLLTQNLADVYLVDIDDAALGPDLTHFTNEGYALIGERFFQSWLRHCSSVKEILTDQGASDITYVQSGLAGVPLAGMELSQPLQAGEQGSCTHGPSLGGGAKLTLQASTHSGTSLHLSAGALDFATIADPSASFVTRVKAELLPAESVGPEAKVRGV